MNILTIIKHPYSKYIGPVLNIIYGIMFVPIILRKPGNILPFVFLLLFIINIFWILIYYAFFLKEDKSNITELRIIMTLRIVVFLGLNVFNLLFNLDKQYIYIYLIITLVITVAIFLVDQSVYKKYKDCIKE